MLMTQEINQGSRALGSDQQPLSTNQHDANTNTNTNTPIPNNTNNNNDAPSKFSTNHDNSSSSSFNLLSSSYLNSKRKSMVVSPSTIQLSTFTNTENFYTLSNELRKSHTNANIDHGTDSNVHSVMIPTLVHKCCQLIKSSDHVEGIFRINGSIRKIKSIESKIKSVGIENYDFEIINTNNETDNEISSNLSNIYDVAMVLKRWLSNLENGLITHDINLLLKQKINSFNNNANDNDYNSSYDLLKDLPIENIHLFIYLLNFLNYLSSNEEIVKITKMTSINLSKIFQLSFFKSDDIINGTTVNTSTDDLLENYKYNEKILTNWIDNSNEIISVLLPLIGTTENQELMQELINSPITHPEPVMLPTNITTHHNNGSNTSLDIKKNRRKSSLMNGYRSLSTALSSKGLSSILGSPSVSHNTQNNNLDEQEEDFQFHNSKDKRIISDSILLNSNHSTTDIFEEKKLRRRSLNWFSMNQSTPSLSISNPMASNSVSSNSLPKSRKRLSLNLDQLMNNQSNNSNSTNKHHTSSSKRNISSPTLVNKPQRLSFSTDDLSIVKTNTNNTHNNNNNIINTHHNVSNISLATTVTSMMDTPLDMHDNTLMEHDDSFKEDQEDQEDQTVIASATSPISSPITSNVLPLHTLDPHNDNYIFNQKNAIDNGKENYSNEPRSRAATTTTIPTPTSTSTSAPDTPITVNTSRSKSTSDTGSIPVKKEKKSKLVRMFSVRLGLSKVAE